MISAGRDVTVRSGANVKVYSPEQIWTKSGAGSIIDMAGSGILLKPATVLRTASSGKGPAAKLPDRVQNGYINADTAFKLAAGVPVAGMPQNVNGIPGTGAGPKDKFAPVTGYDNANNHPGVFMPYYFDSYQGVDFLSFEHQAMIAELSGILGVDYYLTIATIWHESRGDPNVVNSRTNAQGLMQVMPGLWDAYLEGGMYYNGSEAIRRAQAIAGFYGADYGNMQDPEANIAIGMSMYRQLMDDHSDLFGALIQYTGADEENDYKLARDFISLRNDFASIAGANTWSN